MNNLRNTLLHCAIALVALLAPLAAMSQSAEIIRFRLSQGSIGQNQLRTAMEANTSALLTELSRAYAEGDANLNFQGIDISEDAEGALIGLWSIARLQVTGGDLQGNKRFIEKPCLKIPAGYQVSPLSVISWPTEGNGSPEDNAIAINFNSRGQIIDVSITLSTEQYEALMKAGLSDVKDEYARTMIAYWMGRLKDAYETRNLDFFKTILSDNAVIITGTRKLATTSTEVAASMNGAQYEYYKRTKEEYIQHLQTRVFRNYNKIRVNFSDERIKQSVSKPRYYLVDVTQLWNASNTNTGARYSDEGHLFVLWDFSDRDNPTILARIWQAKDDNKRWDFIDFDNLE